MLVYLDYCYIRVDFIDFMCISTVWRNGVSVSVE